MSVSQSKKLVLVLVVFVILAVVGYGVWLAAKPEPIVLQGQMDARQTDVAAKVSGRISHVLVKEGEEIVVGTPLIEMEAPEIDAKVAQAKAARDAAAAVAKKAQNGARPQEIEMAYQTWKRAQAAASLAEVTYKRVQNLANEGLIARQKRDEAYTNYIASRDQAAAAKAQYEMAKAGARTEDIQAAKAQVRQVDAVVAEAEVAETEANLKSPIAGEVADVLAEIGEIVPKGVPVVTIMDRHDQWLVLNVREDLLGHFALGKQFYADIPALGENGKHIAFKVYTSKVLPDFATWRATRSEDSFDMRTFEIKARPNLPIADVRPGMSVLVSLPVQ